MKYLRNLMLMVVGLLSLTGGAAPLSGGQRSLLIRSGDSVAHTEADTSIGQYYTISYQMPADLHFQDVENAMLEIYVDVRAKPRLETSNAPEGNEPGRTIEYVNEAPVLEVFALKEAYTGRIDPERLDATTKAARPVALGSARRVLIDITAIVHGQLDGSIPNFGLIVGSVTGERDGDFRLVSDRLPQGAVGRLRFYMVKGKAPSSR